MGASAGSDAGSSVEAKWEKLIDLIEQNFPGEGSPWPAGCRPVVVNKLAVVRQQLETAIRLFFAGGDEVSIHTLACAAHEVVRNVNDFTGGSSMGTEGCKWNLINSPANFFKHAKEDPKYPNNGPEHFLRFSPAVSLLWIVDAGEKYRELSGERIPLYGAFKVWVMLSFPDIFPSFDPSVLGAELKGAWLRNDRTGFLKRAQALREP